MKEISEVSMSLRTKLMTAVCEAVGKSLELDMRLKHQEGP